jgi:hypothetical protein
MLANSFSSLPVLVNNRWHIITDLMIMHYLRDVTDGKAKKARLSVQLETAIQEGGVVPLEAKCFPPETKLVELISAMGPSPALITDGGSIGSRLFGILTSFDLL